MGVLDWTGLNDHMHQTLQAIQHSTAITGGKEAWNQWLRVENIESFG